jgi:hypothetical protein
MGGLVLDARPQGLLQLRAQGQAGHVVDAIVEIDRDLSEPIAIKALTTHFKFLMRFAGRGQ